jgi:hypothetical protein
MDFVIEKVGDFQKEKYKKMKVLSNVPCEK